MRALRLVQRNAMVFRHTWQGSVFVSVLWPVLYLAAMGLGIGSLVDRGGTPLPGGVSYLTFLAPGLLAATCMQTASFDSSFPISGKMLWQRNYEAITAAPMRIVDVVIGEIAWVALRLLSIAIVFGFVIWLFGAARLPMLAAAIPAAVLTGVAFSAPIVAFSGWLKKGNTFNAMFRFVITPLFLFSGVFFPVTRLPSTLQTVALFTPLYHGVELTRGLTLQTLSWPQALGHLAYLIGMVAAGTAASIWVFTRRLRA